MLIICTKIQDVTHTILKNKIYFTHLVIEEASVNIIGSTKIMEGSGRATILFFKETY